MEEPCWWVEDVISQQARYPLLRSIPELKIVFTQEIGRQFRSLQLFPEPTNDDQLASEEDLRQLLQNGKFRQAFSLTTCLLSKNSSDMSVELILKLWQTRLNLFIKFGAVAETKFELDQFSQFEDLPIQFGQNSLHGGVPFTLLLSVVHLHLIARQPQKSEVKLSKLLQQCQENIVYYNERDNKSFVELWKDRQQKVLTMLVNYSIERSDFRLAISLMENIRSNRDDSGEIAKCEALIGKLFLLFGEVEKASLRFEKASEIHVGEEAQLDSLLCKGLLQIANNDYKSAHDTYAEAKNLKGGSLCAANNMAITALYLGRSAESVKILESVMNSGSFEECIVGNLCALYKLQSSRGDNKKLTLQDTIIKVADETFNCQVLESEA